MPLGPLLFSGEEFVLKSFAFNLKMFDKLEEYLLVSSMVVSVCVVFLQVVMRYVFQNSLTWSEELARYIFLWQCWIGASYAVKKGNHIRVEILPNQFVGKKKVIFEVVISLIWFSFTLFLAYTGTRITTHVFKSGQLSPAMRIPMGYAYASVPVGCFLMLIHLVEDLAGLFRKFKQEEAF